MAVQRTRGIRQPIPPGTVLMNPASGYGPPVPVKMGHALLGSGVGAAFGQAHQTDNTINGIPVLNTPTPNNGDVLQFVTANNDFEYKPPTAVLDIIGSTRGDILFRNATVWTALAPGSAGQVLTAHGAGADLTWTTPAVGDVVGPASAVNNHVVFFDGTTGKLIKDSGLTLSGSNTGDQSIPTSLPPNGAAGGVLSGTYPNPGFATSPTFTGTLMAAAATFSGTITSNANFVNNALSIFNISGQQVRWNTLAGDLAYQTFDNTANAGGKKFRFGNPTGAVSLVSFDLYNETDNKVIWSVDPANGNQMSFLIPVVLPNTTVAGLSSTPYSAAIVGATAFCTDATLELSAGLGLAPIGGGTNKVPLYYDGAWKIG